ncbi:PREDICTED: uncharacterized protein LOC108779390 [Cyphomyrmex costatus]|uniref:Uncharacterized protein n=1 Tax=Cyphomyrmex costatus TaxID=456900 RepID=A0A195C766_9HYME|nr:PREDICTED: uncharacterized protein LOC108779390 [Cyphomyrmex costatus]KYM96480.1 hypothetical protein ALC62_12847 [Cyphomyrmex costatus]
MINHDDIIWMKWGTPMFKGPPTDVFHYARNIQNNKQCGPYELMYVDCMEAYGYHKGKEKCRLILEDLYECIMGIKRRRRLFAMEMERKRQLIDGERKQFYEEHTPPLDLY